MSRHTKATPGPWRAVHNSWSTIGIYADDKRVASDGWRIGEVTIKQEATEENQAKLEEILEANASLIAEAPAMLALLKLQERLELESANCEECGDFGIAELCETHFPMADDIRLKRRALIAKAEGAE